MKYRQYGSSATRGNKEFQVKGGELNLEATYRSFSKDFNILL